MIVKTLQWTCVFALATLTSGAQTSTRVVPPAETLRTFGMVGLAEGQTARLNLLNPGLPAPGATAALCSAAVSFIDGGGTVLKTATVTVIPGQSLTFDLDSDADLKLAVDERHEIRATIQIPPVVSGTPQGMRCRLIPTLEIFDTMTGRTAVVLGRAHFLKDPVPTSVSTAAN